MATITRIEMDCDGPYKTHADADTIKSVVMVPLTGPDMVEVDLCQMCYDRYAKVMTPFLEAGRPVKRQPMTAGIGDRRLRNGHRQARMGREQSANIRQWAREHGNKVSDRGRISGQVMHDYHAAHESQKDLVLA